MRRFHQRLIAAVTSIALFSTQCLGFTPREEFFWTDRTANAKSLLPSVFPPIAPIARAGLHDRIGARLSPSQSALLEKIPAAASTLRAVVPASGHSPRRTIVYVQDVHVNPEAQENIRGMISSLVENRAVDLVGLEGAFDRFDLSPYRRFPDQDAIRATADYLARTGKISGAFHAGMTATNGTAPFTGIDDQPLYDENVAAYRAAMAMTPARERELTLVAALIERQKAALENASLREFDAAMSSYHEERLGLGDYLRRISSGRPDIPAVAQFLKALDLESHLNFSTAEQDTKDLFACLLPRLTTSERQELKQELTATSPDLDSQARLYNHFETLATRHGLAMTSYPSLKSFVVYLSLSAAINVTPVMASAAALERDGYASRIRTERERALIDQAEWARLAQKLVHFSLTTDEWQDYTRLSKNKIALPQGIGDLRDFENFYVAAERRDAAMAANMLNAMAKTGATTAVMVAGGFHTPGLTKNLASGGVTSLVVAPRLTSIDNASGSGYLRVFSQEKTPLDRLLQGNVLFTAPPPGVKTTGALLIALGYDALTSPRWKAMFRAVLPKVAARTRASLSPDGGVAFTRDGHALSVKLAADGKKIATVDFHETPAPTSSDRRRIPNFAGELFTAVILAALAFASPVLADQPAKNPPTSATALRNEFGQNPANVKIKIAAPSPEAEEDAARQILSALEILKAAAPDFLDSNRRLSLREINVAVQRENAAMKTLASFKMETQFENEDAREFEILIHASLDPQKKADQKMGRSLVEIAQACHYLKKTAPAFFGRGRDANLHQIEISLLEDDAWMSVAVFTGFNEIQRTPPFLLAGRGDGAIGPFLVEQANIRDLSPPHLERWNRYIVEDAWKKQAEEEVKRILPDIKDDDLPAEAALAMQRRSEEHFQDCLVGMHGVYVSPVREDTQEWIDREPGRVFIQMLLKDGKLDDKRLAAISRNKPAPPVISEPGKTEGPKVSIPTPTKIPSALFTHQRLLDLGAYILLALNVSVIFWMAGSITLRAIREMNRPISATLYFFHLIRRRISHFMWILMIAGTLLAWTNGAQAAGATTPPAVPHRPADLGLRFADGRRVGGSAPPERALTTQMLPMKAMFNRLSDAELIIVPIDPARPIKENIRYAEGLYAGLRTARVNDGKKTLIVFLTNSDVLKKNLEEQPKNDGVRLHVESGPALALDVNGQSVVDLIGAQEAVKRTGWMDGDKPAFSSVRLVLEGKMSVQLPKNALMNQLWVNAIVDRLNETLGTLERAGLAGLLKEIAVKKQTERDA